MFAAERGARLHQAIELSRAYRGTTLLLADVLEADDEYTGLHSHGVVALSVAVADQMRLNSRERRNVEFGALLHDVGKIAVPKEIINKPGPLTEDEWLVIKTHTIEGQRMLDRVGGLLSDVGRIVRSSHESWDGSGYPDGLAGREIPLGAAIVACCDAFSAMTTDRSYRKAMTLAEARAELQANAGSQFNPAVVDALLHVLDADAAARGRRRPRPAAPGHPRRAGAGRRSGRRRGPGLNSTEHAKGRRESTKPASGDQGRGGRRPSRAPRRANGRRAPARATTSIILSTRRAVTRPPARRPSSPRTSAYCSATCSPWSRSTPGRPPRRSTARLVEQVVRLRLRAPRRPAPGERRGLHHPPVGVAKICAGMRLDTATLCAALLHDTVEDTSASLAEVEEEFGEEIAGLVDGVTKLTGVTFQSRDDRQAENYRKMMVAMAQDIRVILIKLADRLHNMRTLDSMPKHKQQEKARETLDIFAPLAHRLGIHAIKWELEDLAFATLHPRKFNEIKQLVSQQREEREAYVSRAGQYLHTELEAVGIEAEISGRAKHFYSIYSKMTKKGREFNEIYDLTAMRVIVDSVKDCYGAIGVIHSLWKPLPGRFKDWVAMPKFNMYQALHTTVIGPEGRPLEIQIRTMEMHRTAEYGVAAHWIYKEDDGKPVEEKVEWLRHLLDWQTDMKDPQEFAETLKADLFEDEVFVFTPKGELKSLAGGATPLDFAYSIHTDVGHRCVGAKVNGKIVPLHYELQSGDICEVLTSKKERGPSRDWLALAKTTRAQSKIRAWFKRERREDSERTGREILHDNLKRAGLPPQRIAGSPLLADVIREMGFKKGEDFYIALGQSKISPKTVGQQADAPSQGGRGGRGARVARPPSCSSAARPPRRPRPPRTTGSRSRAWRT